LNLKWSYEVVNDIKELSQLCSSIFDEIEVAVVGKRNQLEMIMAAVLGGGHVLMEDYPGLGKTLIASCFASTLGLDFKRIQFTPDLLPGDITGGYIFNRGESRFELRKGPVFANIILADEINRASPKTQSALLEAMQEKQVTIEGETMHLTEPFLVMATQNPIEYEGTFPLPEAQLDRFMIKISIGYPSRAEEVKILSDRRKRGEDDISLKQVTNAADIVQMRKLVETVHLHDDLEAYIIDLVQMTRKDQRVAVGASPRGSLAFMKMARAYAAIKGRDYVIPDDIKHFAEAVLAHRLIMQPAHWMAPRVTQDVIKDVFLKVAVPVLD
jgi:MoxR-like ATPase